MPAKILERTILCAGYLTVSRLRIRLASGAVVLREVEHHGDAVAVLPYDPERRCALVVRLFRAPMFDVCGDETLEEACAGMIDDGDAAATVRREADEELGLRLGDLNFVGRVWPSPGVSCERASLFLALYAAAGRTGAGGGLASENEEITVVERPLADLAADADSGRIADGKLLTLVQTLRLRCPDLFD